MVNKVDKEAVQLILICLLIINRQPHHHKHKHCSADRKDYINGTRLALMVFKTEMVLMLHCRGVVEMLGFCKGLSLYRLKRGGLEAVKL